MLDAQSGDRPSNNCGPGEFPGSGSWLNTRPSMRAPGYGDTGGASRFFFCAKASTAERDAGLDAMPLRARPTMGSGIWGQPDQEAENSRNHHPTVKPVELMRWLCRLTKPPAGGVVLDPFMGSGSTGCGAVLEGRDFIGFDLNPEYLAIARARIDYWQTAADHGRTAADAPEQGKLFAQPSLFSDGG